MEESPLTFDEMLAADREHLPGCPAGELLRACEGCVVVLGEQGRQLHSVTFQVNRDEGGKLALVGRAIDSCGRGWSNSVAVEEAAEPGEKAEAKPKAKTKGKK